VQCFIDLELVMVVQRCHIGPTYGMAAAVIWTKYAWSKVVPFGEIETKPSDPKRCGCTCQCAPEQIF